MPISEALEQIERHFEGNETALEHVAALKSLAAASSQSSDDPPPQPLFSLRCW